MGKRLAIFCDGTWNSADQARDDVPCPTNVLKLALQVARSDGATRQLVHYGQGVGTGNSVDKLTGGAFGHGLEDNLFAAYRFLMLNYEAGDELFLFGFSRGAYTARSLAGMIRKCGILSPRWASKYHAALALYRDQQHPDQRSPAEFRESFSLAGDGDIPIRFIGVWDTVGSLGVPVRGLRWLTASKYRFHDVELSGTVRNACQALAIDERRAPFRDTRWAYKPKPGQVVQQRWFCGAHSDVGGGYPAGEWGLSDIALGWLRDCAVGCGLALAADVDPAYAPRPDPRGPLHNSKTGLYRLTPGVDRRIGTQVGGDNEPVPGDDGEPAIDPTQDLHPSVRERWDADPAYRPDNLREWFRRCDDPRKDT